ncbi:hypothetical protein PUNSTDRAFT_124168 [Punctularia strigosozonata HHB-11173 SS5]|uniref:uncharacterized protein n=1 Tax=Punctularia strigosozonata (strain HHB-11173) TaxID=741275 RepID=UPI0004417C2B|nr:uncharacterized protein PUNSTDRAFT_124168 [Punctularia strigosozonata HHB-11173 SS5]EIN12132.1 hypothetical protein PUNSTDRAFT_124168 [Punctularia strigosozonata HHB-11173 SS5]
MSWSSKYEGWHTRARLHPDPASFTPMRDALQFAALYNAPAEPDGFSLAVFQPGSDGDLVAVDALGKVLVLDRDDAEGLVGLSSATTLLPKTGAFRNQWRVRSAISSRPIDRILVNIKGEAGLVETGVYAFAKGERKLEKDVEGIDELPDALYELVGLVREGREGYKRGQGDQEVVRRVKGVLGEDV